MVHALMINGIWIALIGHSLVVVQCVDDTGRARVLQKHVQTCGMPCRDQGFSTLRLSVSGCQQVLLHAHKVRHASGHGACVCPATTP